MIFEMGIAAAEFQFHVLAVDDSLIDRKLIERLLRTSSYQVTTVDSGNKALEFLGLNEDNNPRNSNKVPVSPYKHQEMEVNLVITDYCMPGMTGYDLLKKIKESSSLKSIPVVIMSSENVPSRINRCLEEGAEEFLLKPVRLSDMNKLKPHLMKSKCSNNFDDQKPMEHDETKTTATTTRVSSSPDASFPGISEFIKPKQQQQYMQQQQQLETEPDSNKRKPVDEEGVLPERTKQKFNGLPVVSHL